MIKKIGPKIIKYRDIKIVYRGMLKDDNFQCFNAGEVEDDCYNMCTINGTDIIIPMDVIFGIRITIKYED